MTLDHADCTDDQIKKKWKFYLLTVGVYIYVCDYIGKYELHDMSCNDGFTCVDDTCMHIYIAS